MKTKTKAYIITFLIAVCIYTLTVLVLKFIFHINNITLLIIIGTVLTVLLSPKKKIVNKQSGKELWLKWIFSKNGYLFKSKL